MARRKKKTWGRRLMRLIFTLILVGILLGGLALGALCYAESHAPGAGEDSQAIIVLGAQVYASGEPSPQLELRLEAALQTYQEKPRLIIACGAQGDNEPAPEGKVMREWLIAHGVSAEDVIQETESLNTRQNLQNAKSLLPEGVTKVTIVTSDYHLPRAMALARDLGLEADGIGSPCKPEYWVKNHAREMLAWGKYLLDKVAGGK